MILLADVDDETARRGDLLEERAVVVGQLLVAVLLHEIRERARAQAACELPGGRAVDLRALDDLALEELGEELAEARGSRQFEEQRPVLVAGALERVLHSALRVVPRTHEADVGVVLAGHDPRTERPAREGDLEVAHERRGGDVALEVNAELRLRSRKRPTPRIDDDVSATRILKRGHRVRREGRLARLLRGTELVEALAAAGRGEDDREGEEKCERGGEAAHEADIGRTRRNPRLERGLRT